MDNRLLDIAKQQRTRYESEFKPLESRFIAEAKVSPAERARVSGVTNADVHQAGAADLNSRLRGNLIAGHPSSTSLVSSLGDNALNTAHAQSGATADSMKALSDQQDERQYGATNIGRGLLRSALATAQDNQKLKESESQSLYDYNNTRTNLAADAIGNMAGQYFGRDQSTKKMLDQSGREVLSGAGDYGDIFSNARLF